MKLPTKLLADKVILEIKSKTALSLEDSHPANKPFPYVVPGGIRADDWTDKDGYGQEVIMTTDIWSQYHGRKEVDEISDQLSQILVPFYPNLGPVFGVEMVRFGSYDMVKDMDGLTFHGILTIRYLINEI